MILNPTSMIFTAFFHVFFIQCANIYCSSQCKESFVLINYKSSWKEAAQDSKYNTQELTWIRWIFCTSWVHNIEKCFKKPINAF